MNPRKKLNEKRIRRGARSRARMLGTASRPRLSVYRSNRYLYAQLIDDMKGVTLISASSAAAAKAAGTTTKTASSYLLGEMLGKKAVAKGITTAVFDRSSYKFHGRVKSFVDGTKKGGLTI